MVATTNINLPHQANHFEWIAFNREEGKARSISANFFRQSKHDNVGPEMPIEIEGSNIYVEPQEPKVKVLHRDRREGEWDNRVTQFSHENTRALITKQRFLPDFPIETQDAILKELEDKTLAVELVLGTNEDIHTLHGLTIYKP